MRDTCRISITWRHALYKLPDHVWQRSCNAAAAVLQVFLVAPQRARVISEYPCMDIWSIY